MDDGQLCPSVIAKVLGVYSSESSAGCGARFLSTTWRYALSRYCLLTCAYPRMLLRIRCSYNSLNAVRDRPHQPHESRTGQAKVYFMTPILDVSSLSFRIRQLQRFGMNFGIVVSKSLVIHSHAPTQRCHQIKTASWAAELG